MTNYSDIRERTVRQHAELYKMHAVYGTKRNSTYARDSFDSHSSFAPISSGHGELKSNHQLNDYTNMSQKNK